MLRFIDSFSHYTDNADLASKWTIANSVTPGLNATAGRFGGGAFRQEYGDYGPRTTLPAPTGVSPFVVIGTAWCAKLDGYAGNHTVLMVSNQSKNFLNPNAAPISAEIRLESNHDGGGPTGTFYLSYQAWVNNNWIHPTEPYLEGKTVAGTLFSLPDAIQEGRWYYLEMKVAWSGDLAGFTVTVRINEVVVQTESPEWHDWDGTPHDLVFGGSPNFLSYTLSLGTFCDLYILDNVDAGLGDNIDFLGDRKVAALFPRLDGTYSEWTPSVAGDHFPLVNEHAPDDDATLVSTNAANSRDTYFMDLVSGFAEINGVQLNNWVRKQDAGVREITGICRSGGVDSAAALGHGFTLNRSYQDARTIWERNPGDAGLWEPADVDAAEFGPKLLV